MTIEEARRKVSNSIRQIYDEDESANIAELVIENITRLSKTAQITKKQQEISQLQFESLNQCINRLRNHEPVQYILGEAWFADMRFYVDKTVLIPRTETEELVHWISQSLKTKSPTTKMLDVGTGSGCIAIALKKITPSAEVWACDISDEALTTARLNADTLHATVDFVEIDFLNASQWAQLSGFDVIVSNPPYIPQIERKEMKRNVIDFEPAPALFVPQNDPLIFYNAIADFGRERLNENGEIYVEIHESLGEKVVNLFQSKGYCSIELRKDLQGKDRMVRIKLY
ncbi:MAG TPA: peptide chain release factor N(5)-glutamine methyltransferase [Chitinophagaceae bacterium]|jgi:release factor glutamine methyltransferase